MKNNDLNPINPDSVSSWLFANGITSDQFKQDPKRYLDMAINALRLKQEKENPINEASTTGSIKGYMGFWEPYEIKAKRKPKHPRANKL